MQPQGGDGEQSTPTPLQYKYATGTFVKLERNSAAIEKTADKPKVRVNMKGNIAWQAHSVGNTFKVVGLTDVVAGGRTLPAYHLKLVAPSQLYDDGDTHHAFSIFEGLLQPSDDGRAAPYSPITKARGMPAAYYPQPINPPLLAMADMQALARDEEGTSPASYLLLLTSYLLLPTSYLLPLTSYLSPLTSYLLPLTSYLLQATSASPNWKPTRWPTPPQGP